MQGEGCGGHKKDNVGDWIRDDSCDMCQRHDWNPMPTRGLESLAEAILFDRRRDGRAPKEYSYDAEKDAWRTAAGMFADYLLEAGFYITAIPGPCDQCGHLASEVIHRNIFTFKNGSSSKLNEDQHPYKLPTPIEAKGG